MVTPAMFLCVLSYFFLMAGEELSVCLCVFTWLNFSNGIIPIMYPNVFIGMSSIVENDIKQDWYWIVFISLKIEFRLGLVRSHENELYVKVFFYVLYAKCS